MWFDDGQHGWLMAVGILHLLIFSILAILGSFALWKWVFGDSAVGRPATDKTPLQILQERYARGDLDREEYEEKKRDLAG
ncbi:MAG: hypothetical protein FD165_1796 [Gammaproteobacteria bacterium]|nr:MAG: hypothetical protein FD165_1796 [Gammaproteobacteria bacterium]TND04369.1 MAG: hypothetical protein FD120_1483 [Gammaproteobacteria bacterium]